MLLQAVEEFATASKADSKLKDLAHGQRMIMEEIRREKQTEDEKHIQLKAQIDEIAIKNNQN